MGHFKPTTEAAAASARARLWFFSPWLPWPWQPLKPKLRLILTTATMASAITATLATLMPMVVMATSMARGLLRLLPLLRQILTTVSTGSVHTTATLATLTSLDMPLSMARGPLKPPLLPSLLLIPTTATMASDTSTARGLLRLLLRLLLIPTTATTVDMDSDTVMGTVDTMAATAMDTSTESKKESKCRRMKTTSN